MANLNTMINEKDITAYSKKLSISELYDITKYYKSRKFITSIIIPNIKNNINDIFYDIVYRYFKKSTVNEYSKIYNICKKQLKISSYKYIYKIINDIIMRDNEDFINYFYIEYNNYDLLNFALIKYCEEYFIKQFLNLDFSIDLKYLACQHKLKLLIGKYYFYNVMFITLYYNISDFEKLFDIIDDQLKDIDLTSLIVDFLPSSSYDKENSINNSDSESSDSSINFDSDNSDEYFE